LREREKLGFTRGACFAHGRANSSTCSSDLFVSRTARAHLEFINPIPAENRMSMRIHKTRQNDPAFRVDDLNVVRQFSLDLVRRTDSRDHTIPDDHPSAFNDGEFAQFGTDPGPFGARQSYQLSGVQDGDRIHALNLPSS
jgi:hypothetical protein